MVFACSRRRRLDTPYVFAAVLVVTLIAVAVFLLVTLIERLTIPGPRHEAPSPSARASRAYASHERRPPMSTRSAKPRLLFLLVAVTALLALAAAGLRR